MGCPGKGGGVHRHDKTDACGFKINLPETGDGRGDVAPQDVDGDRVTQFQADLGRLFGGKAD